MCIFRENTEDIYAGIEWEAGTPEAEKFYRFIHVMTVNLVPDIQIIVPDQQIR